MKKCCFCNQKKPLSDYYINKRSSDGYWAWCKTCEKQFLVDSKKGVMKYVLSFSGGKDSTALLIKIIENKLPLDDIVYFDCEDFEFPEMTEHIKLVEKTFDIKIHRLHPRKPFKQYLHELGWATPQLRWCTNEKINAIRRYTRKYRPLTQYIGYASDETMRINRATKKNNDRKRDYNIYYSFPLVDIGITEQQALEICKSYGFNWGGLYDIRKRVSCYCCPLQKKSDIDILKNTHPKLYCNILKLNKLIKPEYEFTKFIS
jgi:3'-phosphoadenosine 5'-phosphosulfate sulfotransferase (PAPS reductase)/FAD synthetase